jgi:hypothetical protein
VNGVVDDTMNLVVHRPAAVGLVFPHLQVRNSLEVSLSPTGLHFDCPKVEVRPHDEQHLAWLVFEQHLQD